MADDEGGGGGGRQDVLFIMLLILFVAGIWFFTGGAKNVTIHDLFLPPGVTSVAPATIGVPSVALGGTSASDTSREEVTSVTTEVAAVRREIEGLRSIPSSPYAGKVQIVDARGSSGGTSKGEYIIIRAKATNTERITITGWRLESAISGKSGYIGNGSEVYRPGIAEYSTIFLDPGDEAIVATARSPVGTSFRVNSCSGYLTQFQQFTPDLPYDCPAPEREAEAYSDRQVYTDDACISRLEGMRICTIDINPPPELSNACRSFIQSTLTYQGCIARHLAEPDFKKRQWRVFIGYDDGLWRERREVIALIDAQGRLVDSTSY